MNIDYGYGSFINDDRGVFLAKERISHINHFIAQYEFCMPNFEGEVRDEVEDIIKRYREEIVELEKYIQERSTEERVKRNE